MDWTAGCWTGYHNAGGDKEFLESAERTMHWRQWGAWHSGFLLLSELHETKIKHINNCITPKKITLDAYNWDECIIEYAFHEYLALKKTVPTVKLLILCVCVCVEGGGGGVLALNGCRLRGRGIAADGPTVLAWAPPPAHTNIDTHTHTSPGDTPIKCSKPGYTQMSSLVTRSLMTSAVHTHTR